MTVVLVRHGETAWSRDRRHTGRTDVPLTDTGREHARRTGARLAGRAFALVLASPLRRAAETAALARLPDPVTDADLVEWDYGAYEGRTTAEIRQERPDWEIWRDGVPDGEAVEAVGERADRVIARVLEADGAVAVVAHGHLLRVLAARWIGLPAARGGSFTLSTAAVCELGFEREKRVICAWNDASHLA